MRLVAQFSVLNEGEESLVCESPSPTPIASFTCLCLSCSFHIGLQGLWWPLLAVWWLPLLVYLHFRPNYGYIFDAFITSCWHQRLRGIARIGLFCFTLAP